MKKRVLIVDDSPLVHEMYGSQLKDAGFEVLRADDGFSAVNAAFTEMPDLILLDIQMPKINGYQVCRLLKDHSATKDIPIIIMTSTSTSPALSIEDERAGREMIRDPRSWSFQTGADEYIDKDTGVALVGLVQSIMEKRGKPEISAETVKPMSETEIMEALSHLLDKQLYLDVTRLQELNERKSAFVANVSHEFKSPLTILKLSCSAMKESMYGMLTEKQSKTIDIIGGTIDRLNRLVTDLLDLTMIEAGKMKLKKIRFDLSALLNEAVETYQILIDEHKLDVSKEFASKDKFMVGDKDRLMQVVVNILNNSIKFTPVEGRIVLRLVDEDSSFRLEIEDNGPGMSEDGIKKIFDKYERISAEKREGTGLGLPIAKDIVTLHGGKIWAESKEGKGSKFVVLLPRN